MANVRGEANASESPAIDCSPDGTDHHTRREFLKFIGRSAGVVGLAALFPNLTGCASPAENSQSAAPFKALPFEPLAPSSDDALLLSEGFKHQVLVRWNEPINSKGEVFGTNNDFLAFFPLNNEGTDGILWVNHEYLQPLFISGYSPLVGGPRTKEQVTKEQLSVGGSLIRIQQGADRKWSMVKDDKFNRRLTALTPIAIASSRPIEGKRTAIGTFGGCAGGVTPWGTVLTCEENYHDYYGESVFTGPKKKEKKTRVPGVYRWNELYPDIPPEHYGWVVEVDPLTGKAKKHTTLGRFAHECATVRPLEDGRVVVYSGDDGEGRCLYKFISSKPRSLESGTLYVANLETGKWVPLSLKAHKVLRESFKDQLEVLIRCREAAPMVGGTPLDRPEDIEIDPVSGAVLVSLTNNIPRGNMFGSILKIDEKDNNPAALEFKSSTFIAGGVDTGIACPDNMAFDRCGNLWLTTDVGGRAIGSGPYAPFMNNGLFYIPLQGENAGRAFRVASAPVDAELTGPTFSPDGRTLFLSVQHPGETSKSVEKLTSHWPDGGSSMPRSSVVAITGPMLDRLTSGSYVPPLFDVPVLKP